MTPAMEVKQKEARLPANITVMNQLISFMETIEGKLHCPSNKHAFRKKTRCSFI